MKMYVDFAYLIDYWFNYLIQGYDPEIQWYGGQYIDTPISSVKTDQITHRIIRGKPLASCQILTYYKERWNDGFILNVPGLTNYRGFIEPEPLLQEDHVLYK